MNKKEEIKPTKGIPSRPKWLTAEAKREWVRITKELAAIDMLSKVDRAALTSYCQAWARWREAEKLLTKEGILIMSTKGTRMANPAVGVAVKYLTALKAFCGEFGSVVQQIKNYLFQALTVAAYYGQGGW